MGDVWTDIVNVNLWGAIRKFYHTSQVCCIYITLDWPVGCNSQVTKIPHNYDL